MSNMVPAEMEGGELSISESKRLKELEGVIEENFKGFVAVGMALAEIRDRRLYRENYPNFEEYCRSIWEMSHQRADQLIASKQVVDNLTTIVVKPELENGNNCSQNELPLPANEAQARELAKLPPEEQVNVWQRLVNLSSNTGEKITAKSVKKAVLAFAGEKVDKVVEQVKKETRENRTDFQSPAFTEAYDSFFDQVAEEKKHNWRYTSRKTVFRHLQALLDVVSEAVPGTLEAQGCSMELSDREKLKKAGFRIFRMDVKRKLIEEWQRRDSWTVYMECGSAKVLHDQFKELMEYHHHLKG